MNKNIILVAFVIAIFALTACDGTGGDSGPATGADAGFIGGTNGVVMDFNQDTPPAEVFDGGDFPFDVILILENQGEYTVPKEDVQVKISGVLPSEFSLTDADLVKNPEEDLTAREKDSEGNIIDPTPIFVEFNDFNHIDPLVTNNNFKFRADICYGYETIAEGKLCIRENNLETDEGVCKVNEVKKIVNSGAPVQVIELKETAKAKDKAGFTFKIVHQGNGEIFQRGSTCKSERVFENKVMVSVDTGLTGLTCTGLDSASSGEVTLYSGERLISCTQQTTTQTDFVKAVVITLTYDYEENKETNVLVKHSVD